MLYYLVLKLTSEVSAFNAFKYLTTRTGGAILTALLFIFVFGPKIISLLKVKQGRGQPIRTDGPQRHIVENHRIAAGSAPEIGEFSADLHVAGLVAHHIVSTAVADGNCAAGAGAVPRERGGVEAGSVHPGTPQRGGASFTTTGSSAVAVTVFVSTSRSSRKAFKTTSPGRT